MSEITVANTDWEILDDIAEALAEATISGVAVFKFTMVAADIGYAKQFHLKSPSPSGFVLFAGGAEDHSLEDTRNNLLEVSIYLAVKVNDAGSVKDRYEAKMQEIMRLMNAAKNAVETDPPADSTACYDNNWDEDRLVWGSPEIDIDETDPWVAITIPLTVSYGLDSPTAH